MMLRFVLLGFACLVFAIGGCASGTVRSSGATLPRVAEEFDDGTLKAKIEHNCPSSRCKSVSVKFTNMSKSKVTVGLAGASMMRAGQKVALSILDEKEKKEAVIVEPGASLSLDLRPVSGKGNQGMSYTRPSSVWCSLEKHPQCQDVGKADAACAGFARYYYDTYTSTGGWISFLFPYSLDGRNETLASPAPRVVKMPPNPVLAENEAAPAFSRNPDEVVFYKVSCDAKCACKELTTKRNFFLDDKIRPEF